VAFGLTRHLDDEIYHIISSVGNRYQREVRGIRFCILAWSPHWWAHLTSELALSVQIAYKPEYVEPSIICYEHVYSQEAEYRLV